MTHTTVTGTALRSEPTGSLLVIGAGVAGMSCALAAVRAGKHVVLVTPGLLGGSATGAEGSKGPEHDAAAELRALAGGNTALAQGGIAAAIGATDSAAEHRVDTLAAGAGLVDPAAAGVLTTEGVEAVRALLAGGFAVDRDASGAPSLGLEAAHRRSRIVHAGGDRTGAALHAFLVSEVQREVHDGGITLLETRTAESLVSEGGVVTGALLSRLDGVVETQRADAVVLATGGYAALYPRASNHSGAKGEGIVLAAHVGATIADLEFVQFHPTVLAGTGELISEAVRGDGAVLRDGDGHRFMVDRHPLAELAPRDVVSREIHRVLRERGESSVWLDATGIEREGGAGSLARHFPGISAAVARQGLDWTTEPIPVSPAAHYSMGGVVSDLDGRSTVPGLYVVGEVASTGVHGANRLASNSLLEGLVFGARAGRAIGRDRAQDWRLNGDSARHLADLAAVSVLPHDGNGDVTRSMHAEPEISAALAAGLGIERDAEGPSAAGRVFAAHAGPAATLASMIQVAASTRTESRGAHQRSDFPDVDPEQATRRAFRFVIPEAAVAADSELLRSLSPC